MTQIQEAIQNAQTESLHEFIDAMLKHEDYRVNGMTQAAKQRLDAGDADTAKQWLIWAAGKVV
jgi:predicted negative regulator of RcsB-dependent stress response